MHTSGGLGGRLRKASLTFVLSAATVLAVFPARADYGSGRPYGTATAGGAAVWMGGEVWQFGSEYGAKDEIRRFNPETGQLTVMQTHLPGPRWASAAVFDGTYAYIIGGATTGGSASSDILRYDPATDTLTTVATMPGGRKGVGAAWSGQYVYIVGGVDTDHKLLRFDPSINEVTTINHVIDRDYAGVAWGGGYLWTVGGLNSAGAANDTYLRYDPVANQSATMSTRHPWKIYNIPAVFDGTSVLTFGGTIVDGTDHSSYSGLSIYKYEIATNRRVRMTVELPTHWDVGHWQGRGKAMAVWSGSSAHIFGGWYWACGSCNPGGTTAEYVYDDIFTYTPAPGPPRNPVTFRGPNAGDITMTWADPDPTTFSPAITNYKLWRVVDGVDTLIADVGTSRSYVDTGVAAGSVQSYRLSARNVSGESIKSAIFTGQPPTTPNAPIVAASSGPNPGQITLKWPVPNNGGTAITGYRVYGGDTSESQTFLAQTTSTEFVESGLATGHTRFYRVSAVNGAGEGPLSSEVSAGAPEKPDMPRNVQALPGAGVVYLRWDPPRSDGGTSITAYRIYRGFANILVEVDPPENPISVTVKSGSASFLANRPANAFTFTDDKCPLGTVCYYQISAVNGVGEGTRSAEVFMKGSYLKVVPPTAQSQP